VKRIIDDRGRLFGLVSFIDVIVLAVVVVLAVAVFTRFSIHDSPLTTTNTVDVTYTVIVPAVRDTTIDQILPGDRLYTTDTGTFIGTIINVRMEDAYSAEPLIDGTYAMARNHDRYDAILTVEVQASVSDGRFFASRAFELSTNSEYRLQTKYNIFAAYITAIEAG